MYLHIHMKKETISWLCKLFQGRKTIKHKSLGNSTIGLFSNSQLRLNTTIFNRRHLLKRNYKYRPNPKMYMDFPEFLSSISYMCTGLFISYSVSLFDFHSISMREEKQTLYRVSFYSV